MTGKKYSSAWWVTSKKICNSDKTRKGKNCQADVHF